MRRPVAASAHDEPCTPKRASRPRCSTTAVVTPGSRNSSLANLGRSPFDAPAPASAESEPTTTGLVVHTIPTRPPDNVTH